MSLDNRNGAQNLRSKFSPVLGKRTHELVSSRTFDAEIISHFIRVTFQHRGGAVIEWMRQRSRRVNPLQAVFGQRQRREKWRSGAERIDCGTEIVMKSR